MLTLTPSGEGSDPPPPPLSVGSSQWLVSNDQNMESEENVTVQRTNLANPTSAG